MCSAESTPDPNGDSANATSNSTKVVETPVRNPNRRSNKPIMEKRRRARINNCLNELKSILLEAMRKDPARHSKLEKADILELTVSHLKALHRQSQCSMENSRFRAGFTECASEVSRFLATASKSEGMDSETNRRLLNHLADCLNGPLPNTSGGPLIEGSYAPTGSQLNVPSNTPVISLVPSRLANGEIAFVVPNFGSGTRQGNTNTSMHIGVTSSLGISNSNTGNTPNRPMLSPDVPLELTVSSPKCSISPGMYPHPNLPGYMQSASVPRTMGLSPSSGYRSPPVFKGVYSDDNNNNQSSMVSSNAQPLSLVTPKKEIIDDSCWRPW